jgi:hypothetical protein
MHPLTASGDEVRQIKQKTPENDEKVQKNAKEKMESSKKILKDIRLLLERSLIPKIEKLEQDSSNQSINTHQIRNDIDALKNEIRGLIRTIDEMNRRFDKFEQDLFQVEQIVRELR